MTIMAIVATIAIVDFLMLMLCDMTWQRMYMYMFECTVLWYLFKDMYILAEVHDLHLQSLTSCLVSVSSFSISLLQAFIIYNNIPE